MENRPDDLTPLQFSQLDAAEQMTAIQIGMAKALHKAAFPDDLSNAFFPSILQALVSNFAALGTTKFN